MDFKRYALDFRHDGHQSLSLDSDGWWMAHVDHLADKAAALAAKDEQIEKMQDAGSAQLVIFRLLMIGPQMTEAQYDDVKAGWEAACGGEGKG